MSWDSKTNDQWLTVSDVSGKIGSGITSYGSAPGGKPSNQYVTRNEFKAWIETTGGMTSDARWITKNLVNSYIINLFQFTMYGYNGSGSGYSGGGFASYTDAFTYGGSGISYNNVYFLHSTLTINDNFYAYSGGTGDFITNWYQSPQDQWYYVPSANCAILLRGTNQSGVNWGNPIYIADIVYQYTLTYNIYNPTSNTNAEAKINNNGVDVVPYTSSPASGTFNIYSAQGFYAYVNILGVSGTTQSVSISGGAGYFQSSVDQIIYSGVLYPNANVSVIIYLS